MRSILLLAVILILPTAVVPQQVPSIPKSKDVTTYRPIGETRRWTFVTADTVLGVLESKVEEETTIGGISGVCITENLKIDFSRVGHQYQIHSEGDIYVSQQGYYLGSDAKLFFDQRSEEISLRRQGERLEGYYTRGGEKVSQSTTFKSDGFAVSGYYVNRLELMLAMHDIKVGDIIDEEIFAPGDMLTGRVHGEVREFSWQQLHSGAFDSVFIIDMDQPQQQVLFFTRDKRLAKVVFPAQKVRVYLDAVERSAEPARVPKAAVPTVSIGQLSLAWALYTVLGLAVVLFLGGRGWKRPAVWGAFGIGLCGYLVARLTQVPLQEFLIEAVLIPGLRGGESLFTLGLFPALAGGLVQQLLILGGVIGTSRIMKLRKGDWILAAPFVGAGFGLCEACYLAVGTHPSILLSWGLVERAVFIFMHAASASLLVGSLSNERRALLPTLLVLILANSLLRYLPLFVQERVVPLEMMHIVFALTAMIIVGWAVFQRRQTT